jgi:hypothetical protein
MTDNIPGTTFDEQGVCSHCHAYDKKKKRESIWLRDRYRAWIDRVIDRAKKNSKGDYDCLVGYSGGKDSTYLLYLLTQEYGLRVLAYSCDPCFMSDTAKRNAERTLGKLKVDHVWAKPGEAFYKKLYRQAIADGAKSRRGCVLSVCGRCFKPTAILACKVAIEKKIPLITWGFAPEQTRQTIPMWPRSVAITSIAATRLYDKMGLFKRFHFELSEQEKELIHIPLRDFRKLPYVMMPYNVWEYDVRKIKKTIRDLDLIAPGDEHPLSSNCHVNLLNTDLDCRRFGYNPYLKEFSVLTRTGQIDHEEWAALDDEINLKVRDGTWEREKIDVVLERLGMQQFYKERVAEWS